MTSVLADFDRCYRAVESRDTRFDGWFFTAVTSTGIYCRPSCPSVTPRREHVRFYPTAASAQAAGFRACKRCRPDAAPGSPEWNARADLVARAMRLIADGVVDREGVAGLARRLSIGERHLHRQFVAELGAGPLAIVRAQRAQTARLLLETTTLTAAEVAFAAGFGSVRQFNDTLLGVFATTPSDLRRAAGAAAPATPGSLSLRLPFRAPFHAQGLLQFLGARAVPGVEEHADGVYRRTLRLPRGGALVELAPAAAHVRCVLRLQDLRDLPAAVARCRRLLDLDADPLAVDEHLSTDPALAPFVRGAPGRRVPGHVDATELAVRAVLGQQVSVAGARTLAGRLVARYGTPTSSDGSLTHLFPTAAALAEADLADVGVPQARRQAIRALCAALARGTLDLDTGANRQEAERALLALPGIGPWTASYVTMRALGDPDAFPSADLGLRRAAERLGLPSDSAGLEAHAERWRPWRAYAAQHLWASAASLPPVPLPALAAPALVAV